eukprot:1402077-Rhodomonas_salina.2
MHTRFPARARCTPAHAHSSSASYPLASHSFARAGTHLALLASSWQVPTPAPHAMPVLAQRVACDSSPPSTLNPSPLVTLRPSPLMPLHPSPTMTLHPRPETRDPSR